jgi:hypothetical protein
MKTVLEFEGERYELKPLNGEKTHPLTQHAIGVLRDIASKPIPRQSLNPGVANRLARENFVTQVQLPSPFKSHHGRHGKGTCVHLQITDRGRQVLAALDAR